MSSRHRERSGPKRRAPVRKRRRYLIVAEDSKSSLEYLTRFPHDKNLVEIISEGGAGNTLSVVEKGIELRDASEKTDNPFVHVYCVFDKDDFSVERYENAVQKARSRNNVTAIWSNECFELWYLLHYQNRSTGIDRKELYRILKKYLGKEYEKGDEGMYDQMKGLMETALQHSRQLYDRTCQRTHRPWMENPCTNVHKLVEELKKLADIET